MTLSAQQLQLRSSTFGLPRAVTSAAAAAGGGGGRGGGALFKTVFFVLASSIIRPLSLGGLIERGRPPSLFLVAELSFFPFFFFFFAASARNKEIYLPHLFRFLCAVFEAFCLS